MKRKLHTLLAVVFLLFAPDLIFGQAPNLGTASTFALFTGASVFDSHGGSYTTKIFVNELNAGILQAGIYYYVISDIGGVVQSGKLISK
ncbi:MAG: hypothetical protein H6Q14_499 [Bacteroidetes bacterium]|nr:hypothetical protein [Bacteroidota bacterium]